MKTQMVLLGFLSLFALSGCSPKIYKENHVFGTGINRHYEFDIIENDKDIISSIQRNNAEFFSYRLNWGVEKMVESLTYEKDFSNDAELASNFQNFTAKSPSDLSVMAKQNQQKQEQAEPKKSLFKDITDDYQKQQFIK